MCGIRDSLLAECVTDIERARFLGDCAPQSGEWFIATPVPSCGLFLSDEEGCIAVGLSLLGSACL